MSKRDKKRRHEDLLSPIITVLKDGFLGGLLLIAISHGVHVFNQSYEKDYNARHEVYAQFMVSKNILVDNINLCLTVGRVSKKEYAMELKERERLDKIMVTNKNEIPSSFYFQLVQYGRLADADALKNICSLSKEQLLIMRNQINDVGVKLRQPDFKSK